MSIHTIRMPDIGEGIAEVEIVEWRVAVGDSVAEDQTLCDVMTDKAAVEVPSPAAGRVVELGGAVGQVLAVGAVLIRIDDGSEASETVAAQAPPPQAAAMPPPSAPVAAPPPSPGVAAVPPPAAEPTPAPPTSIEPRALARRPCASVPACSASISRA